jgi:hypothetical protein
MDERLGTRGSPGIPAVDHPGERFGKGFSWTLGFATPETSCRHPDHHAAAMGRQVLDSALVPAVNVSCDHPAVWTHRILSGADGIHDQVVTIHGPPCGKQARWDQLQQA